MPEDVPANLRLDHAVIAIADLAAAMADYETLGFTVRFGGEHPGRRTHNALIYFADGSYLELIAERLELPPTDDERENWIRMAPVREGSILLTYALRTEDLAATIAACARRGLTLEGPRAGARLRPDGKRIAWRSAAAANINLPFIIEDVSPRALRILDAEADTEHANGALGVRRIVLLTADVAKIAAEYASLLGQMAELTGATARFTLGEAEILIRPPADTREESALGEAAALPYALALAGGAVRELDAAKSGFALTLQP